MHAFRRTWGIALISGVLALLLGFVPEFEPTAEADVAPADGAGVLSGAPSSAPITVQIDRTKLANGGTVMITGAAPPGRDVVLEIWSDAKGRASRFDTEVDKTTGARPYILYMTEQVPSYYRLVIPRSKAAALKAARAEGPKWSFSQVLKDVGAEAAYTVPAAVKIDRYQATLLGSVVGSRGELLPTMDARESRRRSMQLMKAKFRAPERLLSPELDVQPDGRFAATLTLAEGLAPGRYNVVASVDASTRSPAVSFENTIAFPNLYLTNAGASINIVWPFLLALAISIFGVMMGAGGGFLLNPALVSLWALPHTVVAGTVMPTILFSQASGIANYTRIKFINWKLGVTIGTATIAGGFVGPKLTELVTLDQYKFVFGWILLALAGLMLWQTTPGYIAKNKKEQTILKEFQKRAEETLESEKAAQ